MAVVKANRTDPRDVPTPKGTDFQVLDILISSPEASPRYPSLVRYAVLHEGKVLCEAEARFSVATPEAVLKAINDDIHHNSIRIQLLKELRFEAHEAKRKGAVTFCDKD